MPRVLICDDVNEVVNLSHAPTQGHEICVTQAPSIQSIGSGLHPNTTSTPDQPRPRPNQKQIQYCHATI